MVSPSVPAISPSRHSGVASQIVRIRVTCLLFPECLTVPPKRSPAIYVPLNLVNDDGYPYTDDVDSSSQSSNSTPPSSVSSPSPSPSPSRHTRSPSKGPMPRASNEKRSPELSPIQALRGKGRERIRQSSGVKSKAKTPQMHGPQNVCATPSPTTTLEMVQCGWGGCTKRLHVDYVSVKHWGNHVREHYIRQQEMIECKWNGGCGARINKSSVWKHIVVHQPKFKLRCPRGCEVFTRGDMMKRHLRTCPFTPSGATTEESDEEGGMQSGEVPHVIDYDGGSEDSE